MRSKYTNAIAVLSFLACFAVAIPSSGQGTPPPPNFEFANTASFEPVEQTAPLDTDTITAGLRTVDPDQVAYIVYVQTLKEQGRLSSFLVDSSFDYGKRKPYPSKFTYFKQALNLRAATVGITLPEGTPSLTGTIQGTCFVRVGFINIPVIGATVTIQGTKFSTISDSMGRFQFLNVPLGIYTVNATKSVLLSGSATAVLPTKPPSTTPEVISIRMH